MNATLQKAKLMPCSQIVVRLLGDLFQAIEDLDIQPSEVWKGLEYFTDARPANELGLLAVA